MYSYKHFTPGGKLRCGKIISYSQAVNINPNLKTCNYINNEIINDEKKIILLFIV